MQAYYMGFSEYADVSHISLKNKVHFCRCKTTTYNEIKYRKNNDMKQRGNF